MIFDCQTNAQTLEKISASLNNTSDTGKIESKLDANAKMLEDVRKLLQSQTQEQDGLGRNIETEISEKISTISRFDSGLREQIRGVSVTQKTDELTEYVGSMVSKTEVLIFPAELLQRFNFLWLCHFWIFQISGAVFSVESDVVSDTVILAQIGS